MTRVPLWAAVAGAAIWLLLGLAIGRATAEEDEPPDYRTECVGDGLRVFVADSGISATYDPACPGIETPRP